MKNRLLRTALLLCLLPLAAHAQESPFKIKQLREARSVELIKVGNAWLKNPDRIQATLKVAADVPSRDCFVRAYFYDGAGTLLHTYKAPCPVWRNTAKGLEEVSLPPTLKKTEEADVFFAITDELEAKKWKSVIVVFGSGDTVTARSKPQTALTTLDFPEKALVKAD